MKAVNKTKQLKRKQKIMATKHDLSANETKVSFDLLYRTAQIAVGYSKTECERALGALQTASFKSDYLAMQYAAKDLARASEACAVATDTLHVLQESRTRSKFTVLH